MQNINDTSSSVTRIKFWYYGSTALITLIMAFSIGNYFFNHSFIREGFTKMGFPTYIIYPLAVAKILGLTAIWSRKSQLLTGLAYAGFFYNAILAFFAHFMISDDSQWFAAATIIFLIPSYFSSKRLFANRP